MIVYNIIIGLAMLMGLANVNHSMKNKRIYLCAIFGLIILISSLRHYSIGIDLENQYYSLFLRMSQIEWNQVGATAYDVGYVVFNKIIYSFTDNPQWLIAIHSIIVFGLSGWFIYRNSEDVVLSTFLFIACNTWFMYMNVMRQSLAVSICLICIEIWKQKQWKFKRYILFAVFLAMAVSCHSSALIMILIPIIDSLKFERNSIIGAIFFAFVSCLFGDNIISLATSFLGFRRDYFSFYSSTSAGEGILTPISLYNIILYMFIFMLGIYTLVYLKSCNGENIAEENSEFERLECQDYPLIRDSFLTYFMLFLIITKLMATQSYIVSRMSYYFIPASWIILPRAINAYPGKENRVIIRLVIYILLIVAFVWIGHRSAGDLYGTVPYKFFWE